MDVTPQPTEPKRIVRVILACVQCRNRHVKCDATQPVCNRCKRDGKECNWQKSRRGGLDKAALARRRERLQREAENAQQNQGQDDQHLTSSLAQGSFMPNSSLDAQSHSGGLARPANHVNWNYAEPNPVSFQVNTDRLLELFFENFWPSFPVVIPLHYFQQRVASPDHGMEELVLVLHWIGSIFAPWTPSQPYYEAALQALSSPTLPHTPFVVQALMLFAIAQYHSALKHEGQKTLNLAVYRAIELRMNEKGFAQSYGESDPVLEESWRRTFYILNVVDQHFAIISNSPIYSLHHVANHVDLPCDDEHFEAGQIPPLATWQEYQERELAEVEVIYSSIVYLYDMAKIVSFVMDMFLETGTFGDEMIERCDTRLATWSSLLPAVKREPLRRDGRIDEVMFTAHMIYAITISTMHRPFSSLTLTPEETTTTAFLTPTPFVVPPRQGRGAHTARTLKAIELSTKLLAIPCAIERHNVFTLCVVAQLACCQISACINLLDDRALSIARDRVRLSIGFLNAVGSYWPLGKMMAREVRGIARVHLAGAQSTIAPGATGAEAQEQAAAAEIEVPRDELIWPVDPSAQIDIYSGIVIPATWDASGFEYSSSTSSLS